MAARTTLAVALALLIVLPAAEAAQKPVVYFLKDGDDAFPPVQDPVPTPVPLPIGVPQLIVSGEALLDPYDPTVGNFPNGSQPHMRLVTPGTDAVAPLQFLTPADHAHPDRIKGYLLVGLWPGQSAIAHGNLSATLYEVPASGPSVALANASVALDLNASKLPNATTLLPPNSTDPLTIVYYELAQVLPVVLQPPAYFLLGPLDLTLTNGSRLALDLRLTQGSSPTPLPMGATASMQYESLYTPSFVLVPWFTPDPPKPTTSKSSTSSASRSATASTGPDGIVTLPDDGEGGGNGGGKDTPGPGLAILGAALVAAAFAARRRLR